MTTPSTGSSRLRKSRGAIIAFCIFSLTALCLIGTVPAKSSVPANLAAYHERQVNQGAKKLPVLARLAYRDAILELREGHTERAEEYLTQALTFYPDYPDVYFTLAGIRLRQFNFEATVLLVQGVGALIRDFHSQSLLVVNIFVFIPYLLILVSLITCIAFAIKYLPFAAHKVREFLQTKFNSAWAGFAAYLLLMIPLVVLPGIITAMAYITVVTWMFMYKRERFVILILVLPFILLGLFGTYLKPLTPLADPKSLSSLIARANESDGDDNLIRAIERASVEAEKNLALGLLHQRAGHYITSADHFFRAISQEPQEPMGYINLGNVYYLQGQYEKALEGYRKAEGIEPLDPVCQYALAQAYIKTLLMKEASKSLNLASALGIDDIKDSYAEGTAEDIQVYPKTFSNLDLWKIAAIEGAALEANYLDDMLRPFTRFPQRISAWILLGALVAAILLSRLVKRNKLTFQCSNCGRLTCENCCNHERDMSLCRECASTVSGITSEKVSEALLRQKRQAALLSRRKASRFINGILPGIRDISFGRIMRGFYLAAIFSFALIQVFTKGYLVKDGIDVVTVTPLWKIVSPVAAIVIVYLMSIFAKQQYDFRSYRHNTMRQRKREPRGEQAKVA